MKEQLEKIAPARILREDETPRTGWLVEGEFQMVDGGTLRRVSSSERSAPGRSHLMLHVKVTDVDRGMVVYEFDMAGGSRYQGRRGTIRASGLGRATSFDLVNAAERIYLVLEPELLSATAPARIWRCASRNLVRSAAKKRQPRRLHRAALHSRFTGCQPTAAIKVQRFTLL